MTLLDKTGACLTVTLILAAGGPGSAQSPPPTVPPPTETQVPLVSQVTPVSQAPSAAGAPAEQAAPPARRQRPAKRSPRTSKRLPPSSRKGTFDEARTSRAGGPTRQELTLTANVTGGYDDNVTGGSGAGGSSTAPTAMASGSTALLDATLGYFRGNTRRSIRMDSTGSLTGYPGYLEHPAPGGVVSVGVRTSLGRNLTLGASERAGYEPLFSVYSPGASAAPLPPGIGEAVPATGLFERQSWNSNSGVSLDRRWSRRDSTSLSYTYDVRQFINDDNGDSWSQNLRADYRRTLASGVRASAEYGYRNTEYADSGGTTRPMIEHRIAGGPEFEKSLSRRRSLTFSLAAAASHVESIRSTDRQPYQAWMPSGNGSVKLVLSPTASVEGGYRRDVTTDQGVTGEVYTTDTLFLTTGGRVAGRTDLRVGATYGNWKTPVASGVIETLNTYGGWLQVQVVLTATVAATAAYYYYYHRYSDPGALPVGFPAEYDRNAVRVGLMVRVPLIGTPQRSQR